jgi:WD40 repeat protein
MRMCKKLFFLLAGAVLILQGARAQQPGRAAIIVSSPDGKLSISGLDKDITISDAQTQKEIARLRGHTDAITALAVSPDGRFLASGSQDKSVAVWHIPTGKQVLRLLCGNPVVNLTISADGKNLIARTSDKSRTDWEIATGKVLRKVQEKK